MSWLWYLVAGLASGVVSGLGIGGGTILIPALDILFRMDQQQAQHINLIYFIPTAIIALITHKKEGNIEAKAVWRLVWFGLIGAAAGSMIAIRLDAAILKKLFGWFLLAMGCMEVMKRAEAEAQPEAKVKGENSNDNG